MYCPACDKHLPSRLKVCLVCGGSLDYAIPGDSEYQEALASYAMAKRYFLYWIGGIILGAAVMVLGPGRDLWLIGLALLFGASLPLVIAACYFAKSKGYSHYVGLLVLTGVLGGIALFLLPNKFRNR